MIFERKKQDVGLVTEEEWKVEVWGETAEEAETEQRDRNAVTRRGMSERKEAEWDAETPFPLTHTCRMNKQHRGSMLNSATRCLHRQHAFTHENNISKLESAYAMDSVAFASSSHNSDKISVQLETHNEWTRKLQRWKHDGAFSMQTSQPSHTQTTKETNLLSYCKSWQIICQDIYSVAALGLGLTHNIAP